LSICLLILLDYENYFVGRSNIMSNAKSFGITAISLSVLPDYVDSLTELFSDLYPKFLGIYLSKIILSV